MQILTMRLPTCDEWDAFAAATGGKNIIMQWDGIFSWCQDASPALASSRAVRGYHSARARNYYDAAYRCAFAGFRPAFDALYPDLLGPDGTIVTVGTLYMDGRPVRIPQNPVWNCDVQKYVPNAKLELREALEDPAYQVKAIKAGNSLIADRVLLWNISQDDIQKALSNEEQKNAASVALDSTAAEIIASALENAGYNVLLKGKIDLIAASTAGKELNVLIFPA